MTEYTFRNASYKFNISVIENSEIFALTAHTESSIIKRMVDDKNIDAIAIKGPALFLNLNLQQMRFHNKRFSKLTMSLCNVIEKQWAKPKI